MERLEDPVTRLATDEVLRERGRRVGLTDEDLYGLLAVHLELDATRRVRPLSATVCAGIRALLPADAATFVLSEGEQVYYADEESPERLWKGRRFPATACISGWAAIHRSQAVVEDIEADPRIPQEAYRPTSIRSLAMTPILREDRALGAIGAYWSRRHQLTPREGFLLELLAGAAASALAHAECEGELDAEPAAGESSLSRMIAVVTHDLRNPLAAIAGGTELLLQDGPGGPRSEVVRRMHRSGIRARRLLDDLSEFVALRARGALVLDLRPTRLDRLCRSVVDEARTIHPSRSFRIEDAPVTGFWDADRLDQVVSNLVRNAVQHGDPAGSVDVRVAGRAEQAHVEIHNSGEPIPSELLPVLFDPFLGSDAARARGSLGLGLFIAREIVHAHGGRIDVRSDRREGTTVEVILPLEPRPLEDEAPAGGGSAAGPTR